MLGNKEGFSFELIYTDYGDLLATKKNQFSDYYLEFLIKEKKKFTNKELGKNLNAILNMNKEYV